MYLCGHPGTGKTSSLNYVLGQMRKENKASFKPFMFNAMTYPDVKCFGIVLYQKLYEEFFGEPPKRMLKRENMDDEDLAVSIERLLHKITLLERKTGKPTPQRIIVIDEIDCF